MDRYEARKAIVEDLDKEGYLVKIEDHEHNVGTCYRCHTTIEPRVSKQWFVKMEEIAKPAIEAVKNGDTKFVPPHFDKTYFHWLENIRDWCISRQLWWGHRIPAFYCDDCGEMVVTKEDHAVCPKCGKEMRQDPDTLDTWFSSALWPFSTLGWPDNTEELDYFYPTNVLVTGYDIIFFWVIRMMFSGLEHTGKVPFDTVLIHGLVRDSQGRKMSKSLGNGIDPLEVIDKYGADALRFTLITGNAPGNDMRFYWERVEASRNFANKVWNASRFIQMNMPEEGIDVKNKPENLTDADKWILSKVNTLAKDVTENLDKFELGIAADKIYEFIWEEFCDWYIEMVKPRLYNDDDDTKKAALWTLKKVLIDALKLLHPYMPFITEEIFCNLQDEEETIMLSKWPEFTEEYDFAKEEKAVETIKEAVRNIRNIRSEMNVAPSKKAKVFVVSSEEEIKNIFENGKVFFATLGYASEVIIQDDKSGIGDDAVSVVIPKATIYMPFAELVDISKEIERLNKEVEKLNKELARVNGMLSNPNFVSKAPEKKINEEKAKQAKYQQMMDQVKEQLARLQK
jgi:valyl-tRNA synthetase